MIPWFGFGLFDETVPSAVRTVGTYFFETCMIAHRESLLVTPRERELIFFLAGNTQSTVPEVQYFILSKSHSGAVLCAVCLVHFKTYLT